MTAAIIFRDARVTAWHQRSVGGSQLLELFSGDYVPSDTCFILDNITFHNSSIDWDSMC